jgi:hypothetical protein
MNEGRQYVFHEGLSHRVGGCREGRHSEARRFHEDDTLHFSIDFENARVLSVTRHFSIDFENACVLFATRFPYRF